MPQGSLLIWFEIRIGRCDGRLRRQLVEERSEVQEGTTLPSF